MDSIASRLPGGNGTHGSLTLKETAMTDLDEAGMLLFAEFIMGHPDEEDDD